MSQRTNPSEAGPGLGIPRSQPWGWRPSHLASESRPLPAREQRSLRRLLGDARRLAAQCPASRLGEPTGPVRGRLCAIQSLLPRHAQHGPGLDSTSHRLRLSDGRVQISPEGEHLANQERLLAELTEELAASEAEFGSIRLALTQFRLAYFARFAPLYAELDRLEAELLRLVARRMPSGAPGAWAAKSRAEAAEARARESESAAKGTEAAPGIPTPPSAEIKALYRLVAKAVHPDLAGDEEDRERRTQLMATASQAYADGDQAVLHRILDGEIARPDAIKDDESGARLVRVLRQIAQVRARLFELVALRAALEADPMWKLSDCVRVAGERGGDPLERTDRDLRRRLASVRAQLAALQTNAQTKESPWPQTR